MAYTTKVQIGNRALQMLGATRIIAFTDDSKNAAAVAECYDELRLAELRRNVWRFAIRRAVLTPILDTTLAFVPAAYDTAKTYIPGAIVSSAGLNYIAKAAVPITRTPADYPALWEQYFGAMTVDAYDADVEYQAGSLVYTPATTAAKVYLAMQDTDEDPTTVPAYDATVTYSKDDTVVSAAVTYQSLVNLNLNSLPPSANWATVPATQPVHRIGSTWMQLNSTLDRIVLPSPMTSNRVARSIYALPSGYLREAPQDPNAGASNFLGSSTAAPITDWLHEGNFILSSEVGPFAYRFVADVADVSIMDPMFCGGLAAKIALECCEELTQSSDKMSTAGSKYTKYMSEARAINGIEVGPVEQPEDDFITCRR